MLGALFRLTRLIDRPFVADEEYLVPNCYLNGPQLLTRWRPVTVEEFKEAYLNLYQKLSSNMILWLRKLCIKRGRFDLYSLLGFKASVQIREDLNTIHPIPMRSAPWDSFQTRAMKLRRDEEAAEEMDHNLRVLARSAFPS